jgi:hypothetical protein
MPWLSRNDFSPTDKLHSDDLNALANDDRTWGGNVNGGGYTLSNVKIVAINPTATGSVFSVFGRIGDVVAQGGDYTAAQVGAVPLARQIVTAAGSGLSGGGPLSSDLTLQAAVKSVFGRTGDIAMTAADITAGTGVLSTRRINTAAGSGLAGGGSLTADLSLSVVPDSSNQQVQVMSQGSPVGSPRARLNFISGSGALVTVSENTPNNRIDVTVSSTGTGGFVDPTQTLGDLIVRGISAPATRLGVGADGQVLMADHLATLGVKWATPAIPVVTSVFGRVGVVVASAGDYSAAQVSNAVDQTASYSNPAWLASLAWDKITNPPAFMLDPTVARGDLIVHGAVTTRLPLGADGSILTADSNVALGVKWAAVPITSFNGRGGAVMPGSSDYTVAQINGAVPTTLTINTPVGSGLQGGGNLSQNRSLSVVPDSANQRVQILNAGTAVGVPRPSINFHSGAGVALTIAESVPNNWIDITIASSGSGSGGGMVDPTSNIGDLIVRSSALPNPPTQLPIGANGQVLTVDLAAPSAMKWATPAAGGAGSQTPWLGNIDAAGNNLNNVGGIGVNIASNKTVARVLALVNASEDGFRTGSNSAAGMAAASFINDIGDSICLRSYGSGFVGGHPGMATLEATNSLAILANAAEVMRLTGGHVLIGTATDGVEPLQVNGKIKSLAGGYVFPDGTTQTTAYTAGSSPVTSVFTRTGAVVAVAGDYSAAMVTNAVDSSSTYNNPSWITALAWSKITGAPALLVDPTSAKGDLIARGTAAPATRLAVGSDNYVLTADAAAPLGVKWAAPAAQTPWLTNIDGNSKTLFNAGQIGVGVAAPEAPLHVTSAAGDPTILIDVPQQATRSPLLTFREFGFVAWNIALDVADGNLKFASGGAANNLATGTKMTVTRAGNVGIGNDASLTFFGLSPVLFVGAPTAGTTGHSVLVGNNSSPSTGIGFLHFYNNAIAGTEKRIAYLGAITGSASNSGDLTFNTYNAGTNGERMRITAAGNVGIGVTPLYLLDVGAAGDSQMRIGSWGGVSADASGGFTAGENIYRDSAGAFRALTTHGTLGGGGMCVNSGLIRFLSYTGAATQGATVSVREQMRIETSGDIGIGVAGAVPGATVEISDLKANNTPGLGHKLRFSYGAAALWGWRVDAGNNTLFLDANWSAWGPALAIGRNTNTLSLYPFVNNQAIFIQGPAKTAAATTNIAFNSAVADGSNLLQGWVGFMTDPTPTSRRIVIGLVEQGVAWRNVTLCEQGGAVGIGLVTPQAVLDVNGDIRSHNDLNFLKGSSPMIYTADNQTLRFGVNSAERMRISQVNGAVGIAHTTPEGVLTAGGAIYVDNGSALGARPSPNAARFAGEIAAMAGGSYTDAGFLRLSAGGGTGPNQKTYIDLSGYSPTADIQNNIVFGTHSAERVRITDSGMNVTGALTVNGAAVGAGVAVQLNSNAYGSFTTLNFFASTGISITNGGMGSGAIVIQFSAPSDLRLKRNVQPLTGGLPLILQLRPVSAEWNGLANTREGERFTGVIAQELQEIIPGAVAPYRATLQPEDQEPTELLGYDSMAIISHLILAIQELEQRLKAVEQKPN